MAGITADITPDYAYYTDEYHGTMDEVSFMGALSDAVAEVGYALWPQADLTTHGDKVKHAICGVADAIANPEKRRRSYSAGKVREEYSDAGFSLTAEAAIRRYLAGTGVLKYGQWL